LNLRTLRRAIPRSIGTARAKTTPEGVDFLNPSL
jgi:hypothetical protein